MTEVRRHPASLLQSAGGVITAVPAGTPAAAAGLRPGDVLLTINGHRLRDAVDVQFYAAEPVLELSFRRGEAMMTATVVKHPDETLGVAFEDAVFDGVRICNNNCFFCFLKGLPKGLRRTLYVKDDDYRLSFFHGNFVTLTNLTEADWRRLEEQRLSPLNVSVHATEPAVRAQLLGNPGAADIMQQLRRLAALNIRFHTQVVLCPGVNDGAHLDRTIRDLASLWPSAQSIAVVPVGQTEMGEDRIGRAGAAAAIAACTPERALAIVQQVRPYQQEFRSRLGSTLVYLADEFYLAAGLPVPAGRSYDGYPQYENGIGMTRTLIDGWRRARNRRRRTPSVPRVRRAVLACGTLIAPVLAQLSLELASFAGIDIRVIPIENRFFGPRVNVSGLLTAADLIPTLRRQAVGADAVFLPRYALDYAAARFLDGVEPAELQLELGTPVAFVRELPEVLRIVERGVESSLSGTVANRTTAGKSWSAP